MHELSLYGPVVADNHLRLLQDLAGVTCMQPLHVHEVHLLFKARQPIGVDKVLAAGSNQGTDTRQQQEFQKLNSMLRHGLFYVKLVGTIQTQHNSAQGGEAGSLHVSPQIDWVFEFKDTPEVTKQPVNNRLVSRIALNGGDMMAYMEHLGFEYVIELQSQLSG